MAYLRPLTGVTVGLENAPVFGTTRYEYKLWIDYIFEWFDATLENRFRRYLLSISLASSIWIIGLLISTSIGFTLDYIETPAIYLFLIGIAWCSNSLRWLSQVYHDRTNNVRPCFPVDDQTYKAFVSSFARKATQNAHIIINGLVVGALVSVFFGSVMLGYINSSSTLALAFPSSFPEYWFSGSPEIILVKLLIISLFLWTACVEVSTGVRLTLATAPLYPKLAKLPVLPLPSLVTELFQGVLNLYLTGAVMWSFGIVLIELLYKTQVNALGIAFLVLVIGLGVSAYIVPLEAVRRIWRNSKRQALGDVVADFYKDPAGHSAEEIRNINEYLQSLGESEPGDLNITRLLGFVGGQLLPVLPLLANTYLIKLLAL